MPSCLFANIRIEDSLGSSTDDKLPSEHLIQQISIEAFLELEVISVSWVPLEVFSNADFPMLFQG